MTLRHPAPADDRRIARGRLLDTLSDEQLVDLLQLTLRTDSVELKLTVPLEEQRAAIAALGFDPLTAQIRLVHFFDTPDLELQDAGVVVRARRIQGKGDDTVVKLRPCSPKDVPKRLRQTRDFVVEIDAMPNGYTCSGSLKGVPAKASVVEVAEGGKPLHKLFSKQQRAFFDHYAPEDITLDDLELLGPIFVLKLKGTPEDFHRKLVVELWLYPDGSRILELSTKCRPADAFEAASETREYLAGLGIDLLGEQQTKTRTALEYFAAEIAA